jgi:hypothetical protein
VPTSREGGGVIDLPRADVPLIFATPTGLSFGRLAPSATAAKTVAVADAGGGAGDWAVTVVRQTGSATVTVPPLLTVPGSLTVSASTAGAAPGDVTGFVVLTRGSDVRRIPFWLTVSAPQLASEAKQQLVRPGTYQGTTKGAPSRISQYRYPTGGDREYPGPERAYRVSVTGRPANFGVVVLSGRVTPHVTFDGAEDHLAGYPGLPLDLNPYRDTYGRSVPTAGAVLPGPGAYDIVFDTQGAALAGPFTFRYWVNDVTPPRLKLHAVRGAIVVTATDSQSGVDPTSVVATLDGKAIDAKAKGGAFRIAALPGRHTLAVRVSDYQEQKNMEDVPPTLPNTATLRATVRVP